ncbi:MAG: phage integrase SAM-like domain-containing protein, partial [Bacteroidota bacterium]
MINIRPLLRQPNNGKGRKAIYFTVRYQNQTAILYPKLSVHSNDWVSKNGASKPKDIPENYGLKDQLYDYEKLIRETHLTLQKRTPNVKVPAELLKKTVYAKHLGEQVDKVLAPKKETRVLIADFFQTFIDDSRNKRRLGQDGKAIMSGTIATYETCKKHFIEFQDKQRRKYYFTDLDQRLIDSLSAYFINEKKLAFNGVGKHMKTFKSV